MSKLRQSAVICPSERPLENRPESSISVTGVCKRRGSKVFSVEGATSGAWNEESMASLSSFGCVLASPVPTAAFHTASDWCLELRLSGATRFLRISVEQSARIFDQPLTWS